jgi:hypothetical protein
MTPRTQSKNGPTNATTSPLDRAKRLASTRLSEPGETSGSISAGASKYSWLNEGGDFSGCFQHTQNRCGEPKEVEPAVVGRGCHHGERHLGVRVGNVETSGGGRQVFGAVAKADQVLPAAACPVTTRKI